MADFPKPTDQRPQLTLPSKSGLITLLEEREKVLKQRYDELVQLEGQLQEQRDEQDTKRNELESRTRVLQEGEMLLKNKKLLHQKQFSQLLEQNELVALRVALEQRRVDFERKEDFLAQTEKRFNEQFSACEQDLIRREAWVSAEHEKAILKNTRRLQAVVFTDVVSYSTLMQTNEGLTIQKVRADLQRMQTEGESQGGLLVNTMGDGMLMIFPSAIQAVRFSLDMQRALNRDSGTDGLQHRFGIHIADVALLPDGGIAGDGVNVASRLESKAPNGGICLSGIVYAIVKGKLPLPPSAVEEIVLKNIAEPVAAFKYTPEAILAMEVSNHTAPPDMTLPDEERSTPPFPPDSTGRWTEPSSGQSPSPIAPGPGGGGP